MLTRLKVSSFKNLVDVDIQFGPFTCIAGANGVGKSNLFDCLQFLSALANHDFVTAAMSVRNEGQTGDIRSIFHRIGNEISIEVEMIIPHEGLDKLHQKATAKITFLKYKVVLVYREDEQLPALGRLELTHESLEYIRKKDAPKKTPFKHAKIWEESVITGASRSQFISTEKKDGETMILLRQDGGGRGRPKSFLSKTLPRTVLSDVNATESPTALLARNEMASWRLLQLEPSALREPDSFTRPPGLGIDGSHLPATLTYLQAQQKQQRGEQSERLDEKPGNGSTAIYDQLANTLSELIEDVYAINIARDETRQLLILEVTDKSGTIHPARSLSDGTLRFLALAVLELDPTVTGVICLEEPENGIHPARISAILELLQNIVVDTEIEVDINNPLRQVIINTHSPTVVQQVPDDSLLIAELKEIVKDKQRFKQVQFSWLPDTWRSRSNPDIPTVQKGKLLSYLKPVANQQRYNQDYVTQKSRRVIDRSDLQQPLPFDLGEPE
jgi:predicted ATPase